MENLLFARRVNEVSLPSSLAKAVRERESICGHTQPKARDLVEIVIGSLSRSLLDCMIGTGCMIGTSQDLSLVPSALSNACAPAVEDAGF